MSEKGYTWNKAEGEVAAVIPGNVVGGSFVIEQGHQGLLFVEGRMQPPLGEGRHDLVQYMDPKEGALSQLRNYILVVADMGIIEARMAVDGLRTSDPVQVRLDCRIRLRIENLPKFHMNLLKSSWKITARELAAMLAYDVRNCVAATIKGFTIKDMVERGDVCTTITDKALEFRNGLAAYGLSCPEMKILGVSCPQYNDQMQAEEDLVVQVWDKESRLEGRKRLFEIYTEEQLQDIAETETEAELAEQRLQVFDRLRQATLQGKMDELRTEQEFEDFLDEMDTHKVLQEQTRDQLARAIKEEAEDHAITRSFLLKKLGLEHELELKSARFKGEIDLKLQYLNQQRVIQEKQGELDELEVNRELAKEEKLAIARRKHLLEETINDCRVKMENAKTEHEQRLLEIELDRIEGENGLALLRETQLVSFEKESREFEQKLKLDKAELENKIRWIESIASVPLDVLITREKDPEKLKSLIELYRIKNPDNRDAEKILASAAATSPAAAQAFQEKYKNADQGSEMDKLLKVAELLKMFGVGGGQGNGSAELIDLLKENKEDMLKVAMSAIQAGGGGAPTPPQCPECGNVGRMRAMLCDKCGYKY